jgi:magnesium transporter
MISVCKYHGGALEKISLEDYHPNAKFIWIDCLKPTKKEISYIAEKTGVDPEDIRDSLDESERPRISANEKYSEIVFREPYVIKKELSTAPVSIFFSDHFVLTLRNYDVSTFIKIHSFPKEQHKNLFDKGIPYFVFRILDIMINNYFSIMDKIEDDIDYIEGAVLRNPGKDVVKKIFEIKKTLIYFHKASTAEREVLTAIEKQYSNHISMKQTREFRTLYNDVTQLIDMEATYREILTGILDMYLSSVSNNLNELMKKLTVIASFVLIPTLISGIYGMNFNRIYPDKAAPFGFWTALGIMVISILIMYVYFKKMKWI